MKAIGKYARNDTPKKKRTLRAQMERPCDSADPAE
jgi:hypothetical protein